MDRDREPVEQQLDLHRAHFVRLGVPVNVGQQLGDAQRCLVDQGIEMPVAQLRRKDSADLTDPRRQGLELHRAVPAWLADHGCDSPNEVRKKTKIGSSSWLAADLSGGLDHSVTAGAP